MATPHNLAEVGQIAPDVLMPGDPKRAARIAEVFLDDARLLSEVRGMESAGLYSTAMVERAEALTILTATDHLGAVEQRLTPEESEDCFLGMVELAVTTLR